MVVCWLHLVLKLANCSLAMHHITANTKFNCFCYVTCCYDGLVVQVVSKECVYTVRIREHTIILKMFVQKVHNLMRHKMKWHNFHLLCKIQQSRYKQLRVHLLIIHTHTSVTVQCKSTNKHNTTTMKHYKIHIILVYNIYANNCLVCTLLLAVINVVANERTARLLGLACVNVGTDSKAQSHTSNVASRARRLLNNCKQTNQY